MLALCACEKGPDQKPEPVQESSAPAPQRVDCSLPGADGWPSDVAARVTEAESVASATTQHRQDGKPIFRNRLILETSPYLRREAHGPVNWYPWSEEAFQRARELERPVLLSVGDATCQDCWSMDRDSFDDADIARFLNEEYVAIKVDRRERPDVAHLYARAFDVDENEQARTVWLDQKGRPFHHTTYRQSHGEFLSDLKAQARSYREQRATVSSEADARMKRIERSSLGRTGKGDAAMQRAYEALEASFDTDRGGWGSGHKLPLPSRLLFLLHYHRRTQNERAVEMVTTSLDAMLEGGIWDESGGGFYRYALDATWQKPHVEKTLYDNAQLLMVLTEAYRVTRYERYREAAAALVEFVEREMKSDVYAAYHSAVAEFEPDDAGVVDPTLISGWNGLYLEALARAAFVFEVTTWRENARALGAFLMRHCVTEEGWLLRSRIGNTRGPRAFADDYAFVIAGFIELFQVTGARRWISNAIAMQTRADGLFRDGTHGSYFFSNPEIGRAHV